jgi:RHS repeat-associated protein
VVEPILASGIKATVTVGPVEYWSGTLTCHGDGAVVIACVVVAHVNAPCNPICATVYTDTVSYATSATGGTGTVTFSVPGNQIGPPASSQLTVSTTGQSLLTVVAAAGAVTVPPGAGTIKFTVTNRGTATDSVVLNDICTGAAIRSCQAPSPSQFSLAAGASIASSVLDTATSTAGATGTVLLAATVVGVAGGGARAQADTGWTAVTIATPTAIGLSMAGVTSLPTRIKSLCVEEALAARAASTCGALRFVHPLPPVGTYAKVRTPTLIYDHLSARAYPSIAALLTLAGTGSPPDSVTVTVLIRGTGTTSYTTLPVTSHWFKADFAIGSTRRIDVPVDLEADTTGLYDVVLVSNRYYTSEQQAVQHDSAHGQLLNVNRGSSHFGAGWWLAGLEQIFGYSGQIGWVGGDGSTRVYTSCGTNVWCPTVYIGGRDSIMYNSTTAMYTRYAGRGVRVVFNGSGRHTYTIDRLGDTTRFGYATATGQGYQLTSVAVPRPGGTLTYAFTYNAANMLASIAAPGPAANGPTRTIGINSRAVTGWVMPASVVTSIVDPDATTEQFGYGVSCCPTLVDTLRDKRHTETTFGYDGTGGLAMATTPLDASDPPIVRRLRNANVPGYGGTWITTPHAVIPDSAYTMLIGPRMDTTKLWLDPFAEPSRVRNALGYETQLARGNATYPTLVTRYELATRHVLGEAYDPRGNPASESDSDRVIAGQVATTHYRFDPRWDFVTLVDPPLHDSISMAYDTTTGNRLYQQDSRGSGSRTAFTYYATGTLAGVHDALGNSDSIAYDAVLSNVAATRTPIGFWTRTLRDAIGRDTLTTTPLDSAQTRLSTVHTTYDVLDRPITVVASAPATGGFLTYAESTTVRTTYAATGQPLTVARSQAPDNDRIGTLTTTFHYDTLGRVRRELEPDGQGDSLIFDPAGNVVDRHSRRGFDVLLTYDALNRLTRRITPAVTTYPDTVTNVQQNLLPPLRDSTPFPYYPNTTTRQYVIYGDTALYTYDAVGDMVAADNRDARVHRQYSRDGMLAIDSSYIRTAARIDSGGNFTAHAYGVGFGYDLDGRRSWVANPSTLATLSNGRVADTVRYTYDAGTGGVATITDPFGNVTHYYYGLSDRLDSLVSPGGLVEQYASDPDDRLAHHVVLNRGLVNSSDTAHFESILRDAIFRRDARGKVIYYANKHEQQDTVYAGYTGLGQVDTTLYLSGYTDVTGIVHRYANIERSAVDPLGNRIAHLEQIGQGEIWVDHEFFGASGSYSSTGQPFVDTMAYTPNTGREDFYRNSQRHIHYTDSTDYDAHVFDANGNLVYTGLAHPPAPGNQGAADTLREAKVLYYGADELLRMTDLRRLNDLSLAGTLNRANSFRSFEEYRYDALGRRVWVRARLNCENNLSFSCWESAVQRTIWDGSQTLIEIQALGADSEPATELERDTGYVNGQLTVNGNARDISANYGRVAYVNGPRLDEPVEIIRYAFGRYPCTGLANDTLQGIPVLVWIPAWNWQGTADNGSLSNGAYSTQQSCDGATGAITPPWTVTFSHWGDLYVQTEGWYGTIPNSKLDQSGQMFYRNRYYDPSTGRFTQEDPLGLAGGLNAYGFATGDPVNYSDPFGLCPYTGGTRDENVDDCPNDALGEAFRLLKRDGGKVGIETIHTIATDNVDVHLGTAQDVQRVCQAQTNGCTQGHTITMLDASSGDMATRLAHEATHVDNPVVYSMQEGTAWNRGLDVFDHLRGAAHHSAFYEPYSEWRQQQPNGFNQWTCTASGGPPCP